MIRAGAWAALLLLVAAPLVIVLCMGFGTSAPGVPPVLPPIGASGWQGSFDAWGLLFADTYYLDAALRSLRLAAITAGLCLVLGFGMALGIASAAPRWQAPLLALVLLPFWSGFVLRLAAWVGLLRDGGWINAVLIQAGLISEPMPLLYSEGAMLLGMVHGYLPFAVLPLTATLARRDLRLEEAAADLGAGRWMVFATITLPLAAPAAAAAFLLVFIPAAGEVVIPEVLGAPDSVLIGRAIWGEFFQTRDWPAAAALATALLALLLLPIALYQRFSVAR
ncbi:ABC transporter permease [Sediminicoccus sp. KRV36]|uniref:ABC transporter permease n=1 Tax=Sediminicoccus sp. KRV36 TaxID=3133721 RepID=UPI00200C1EAE|nr:ABC transporter permease [Sediminicoccus rosea]UPY36298.1 ABC transporter permease [Sediminicoccus rosea]